jgi:hypothetical protein
VVSNAELGMKNHNLIPATVIGWDVILTIEPDSKIANDNKEKVIENNFASKKCNRRESLPLFFFTKNLFLIKKSRI